MYRSMQDVRKAVEERGYLVVTMQELKSAFGVERCTSGNLEKISIGIKKFGFDHLPVELPNNQGGKVTIVFDHDSPSTQATVRSSNHLTRRNKVLLTKEERYGDRWNNFGEQPNEMEYAEGQLINARASRDYSVLHGRKHPYSTVAKDSYEKAVERCFACELKVFEVYQDTEYDLPNQLLFEYFDAEEVPQNLIGQAPEGSSIIEGYTIKGVGKLKVGEGIKLPVSIRKRKAK